MYWIQPYFSNNPSYAVISAPAGLNATAPTSTVSHLDVSHNMDVSPEIWLGYIGDNGFGFRARWWYYRQDTSQSIGFNASPLSGDDPTSAVFSASPLGVSLVADNGAGPLSFNATTKLQLQVWDVEALQDIQVGGFDLLFSGGLRFAHINQEYDAFAIEPGATMPRSSVTSSNSFDGLGPVIDLEARRAIGNTGIALYGCARGALLFGSAHQTAFGTNVIDGGNVNASDSHDRVMPVGELELGLEYSQRIGNARIFGQMALVGQDWLGAGNASRSNTFNFAGVPDGGTTTDSDLGFFGLAFRLGVNY